MAEKWRTGLAAFVTLATGGLLLKGPSAASDVTTGWRIALTILALGGLLTAIAGLWLALQAAAGAPAKLNLAEVVAKYGGVRQFEVACALAVSAQLRLARLVVAGALLLFVAAIGTWWWAPSEPAQPPALISITTSRGTVCGTLVSGDSRAFTVRLANAPGQVQVPLAAATSVQIVASCLSAAADGARRKNRCYGVSMFDSHTCTGRLNPSAQSHPGNWAGRGDAPPSPRP